MADLWMDVDTALSEVPVNLVPLVDDDDFVTIKTAIAYNEAGMDLRWNFCTTGGAMTSTPVTPTTSGDYDWSHQGDGMYSIEIPASGGASINNDTEGFGWFSGVMTDVAPFRGPVIGFRAAALNNSMVDGGTIDVNVIQISGSSTPADNAELFFVGTTLQDILDEGTDSWGSTPPLYSGTAASATGTTVVFASDASDVDDFYNGTAVRTLTGTGAQQDRLISDYVGATRTATVTDAWATTPDNTTTLRVDPARVHVDNVTELQSGLATATSIDALPTAADNAAALLASAVTEALATPGTAGTVMQLLFAIGVKVGAHGKLERIDDTLTGYAADKATDVGTWDMDDATNPTSVERMT